MSDTEREKNNKKRTVYRVVFVFLLLVIVFCLIQIGKTLYEYYQGSRQYEELQEISGMDSAESDDGQVDFAALLKVNPQVKAWLSSPETEINYPVVQGKDNAYYLYHTVSGEENSKGSLFIDYRCEKPFEDFNTIIYGHRMKDGSMFHELTRYTDANYFAEHPKMALYTPERDYQVEIFAVVRIPSDSALYKYSFQNRQERQDYLEQIRENSLIHTQVRITAEDSIVMMSTCTYEFEEARLVVYGKLSPN